MRSIRDLIKEYYGFSDEKTNEILAEARVFVYRGGMIEDFMRQELGFVPDEITDLNNLSC